MDMCYDGTLVLPSSYAVMGEQEMSYLEGENWNVKTLWYNIVGAVGQYSVFKSICKRVSVKGKTIWAWACSAVSWEKIRQQDIQEHIKFFTR